LYEAMLASVFEDMLARVRELAVRPTRSSAPLAGLIRLYAGTMAAQPWLPALLMREVITGDAAARARFIERFAKRGAALLPGLVSAEIASGALRDDLDPVLTLLALVGGTVFPFLAFPVLGKLLGYQLDGDFAERLAAHTAKLFLEGARPRAEAP
jgi:TetR/AcrR family transcriptional regulator